MLRSLQVQILLGLVLAVVVGYGVPEHAQLFGISVLPILSLIGSLFLNALKMIVVPLIIASLIVGVAGVAADSGLGRLGLKTLLYYLLTSSLAILVGLALVNLIRPGFIDGSAATSLMSLLDSTTSTDQALADKMTGRHLGDLAQVFKAMLPPNVFKAAAEGQLLGVVVFSLMYGTFLRQGPGQLRDAQLLFWRGVNDTMMRMTGFVIRFAPLGVFALVAVVLMKLEAGESRDFWWVLIKFSATVVLALAIHALIVLPLLLKTLANISPWQHMQAMRLPLLTAFSTASSAATLPLTLQAVSREAGVSHRTTSFVVPLGATVNMDGTALYECIAALFIAQVMGLELSFVTQLTVVIVALLTSIGVAGVPSASLVAIAIILDVVGLPIATMILILPVDRLLDMFRTAVNVYGDSCGAVIIASSEGETPYQADHDPSNDAV
ncbi:MAG: dicarboxylate/amino acid:cation symporter [Gammaproteobacteria bacterium]|nr:dicarboxylate/amino acid:cation symporter [Gammaproteobacteria bacterium]